MRPWVRIAMLFMGLLPSFMAVLILWKLDALNQGGPLLAVLCVPVLAWCGTQIFNIFHNTSNQLQDRLESDPPPKYEKVIQEPPPYECLHLGKTTKSEATSHDTSLLEPSSSSHMHSESQVRGSLSDVHVHNATRVGSPTSQVRSQPHVPGVRAGSSSHERSHSTTHERIASPGRRVKNPAEGDRLCCVSSSSLDVEVEPRVHRSYKKEIKKKVRCTQLTVDPDLPTYQEAMASSSKV